MSGRTRCDGGDAGGRASEVSRTEVAGVFMRPAPLAIVERPERGGSLTTPEASVAHELPVASDIYVEADSGGHADRGSLSPCCRPTGLRNRAVADLGCPRRIRVGASGAEIPEAVAAAFVLGPDFILTGSVN